MGRYALSASLASCVAGLTYSWFTTGAPMALVYYGYPLLLAGAAVLLAVLTFAVMCVLTRRPRRSSLATVAALSAATLVVVTVTTAEILDRLWWRAFAFYTVFIIIPSAAGAISTWVALARRPLQHRGG